MSPLVPTGTRGYADWQRVDNWDGPTVWNLPSTVSGGNLNSGVQDVSRYGYVGGLLQCTAGICRANVNWFNDVAGTIPTGGRSFPLHNAVTFPMQLRLPNLGPFCQIGLNAVPGQGNYTAKAFLINTNRTHALEFIPDQPQLLATTGFTVPANTTSTLVFGDYFAGPARVSVFSDQNGAALELDTFDTSGGVAIFDKLSLNFGLVAFNTIIPPGACYIHLIAAAGAATGFSVYITPSLTGG